MACGLHTCKIGWCHPNEEELHAAKHCTEIIQFKHGCGHNATRECCSPEAEQKCQVIVDFFLSCGHSGRSVCHIPKAEFRCEHMVRFRFQSCGHEASRKCYQKERI